MGEYVIIGPPGTGKTQFLNRQAGHWSDGIGLYSRAMFTLACYTNAAANEAKARIPGIQAATLHSLGYRALGGGLPIIEVDSRLIALWDESYPHWAIGDEQRSDELPRWEREETTFDLYMLWRALGSPPHHYLAERVRRFAQAWADFKRENNCIDFMDMIEIPLKERLPCPTNPRVLMVDEAQDLFPLQWSLVQFWASEVDHLFLAGDPAQCIYAWVGASPTPLVSREPLVARFGKRQVRILQQSYRMAEAVKEFAEFWLGYHSGSIFAGRNESYRPRCPGGLVEEVQVVQGDSWEYVMPMVIADLEAGKRVMLLGTCAYIVREALPILRAYGIPYANPYRPSSGEWNPFTTKEGSISTRSRVLAFLAGHPGQKQPRIWGNEDLALFVPMLKAEVFRERGAKSQLLALLADEQVREGWWHFLERLRPEHQDRAMRLDMGWLLEHVLKDYRRGVEYCRNIVERRGLSWLLEEPRCIVGTIHSVKGGEADSVYLDCEVSYSAWREAYQTRDGFDALVRTFYVGLTRAREKVVVINHHPRRRQVWLASGRLSER